MKLSALLKYHWLIALIVATTVVDIEARGGRRGGSALGGLFGGLRKHKKQSSGGSGSRRTINGSPMHVSQSVILAQQSRVPQQAKNKQRPANHARQSEPHVQRQPFHVQHHTAVSHYSAQHPPPLPPGGVYYINQASLPSHAVYYTQPPARYTAPVADDFLTGVMIGSALSHRHTYLRRRRIYYTDPPLEPFNATITPVEVIQPNAAAIFPPRHTQSATSTQPDTPQLQTPAGATPTSTATTPIQQQTMLPEPIHGIICLPMLFNETEPTNPSNVQTVERLVCYPAPPPPPPTADTLSDPMQQSQLSPQPVDQSHIEHGLNSLIVNAFHEQRAPSSAPPNTDCVMRTFVESDPNDASKTIEVQREYCRTATTQKVQVAGEIHDNGNAGNNAAATTMVAATTTKSVARSATPVPI